MIAKAIDQSCFRDQVLAPSRDSSRDSKPARRLASDEDLRRQDVKKQRLDSETERPSGFSRMLKDAPTTRVEPPAPPQTARPPRQIKLIDLPTSSNQRTGTPIVPPTLNPQDKTQKALYPNIDAYHGKILSWDYWNLAKLEIQPSGVGNTIPDAFATVEDYAATFEPLLLEECRAQILRGQEENNLDENTLEFKILDVCCGDRFHDVGFQLPVNNAKFDLLSENDLMVITFAADAPSFTTRPTDQNVPYLMGKVLSVMSRGSDVAKITLRLNIHARLDLLHTLRVETRWVATRLMNLSTINREFQALRGLKHLSLCPILLDPKKNTSAPVLSDAAIRDLQTSLQLNASQARAVATVARHREGFTLIQGPPGTVRLYYKLKF
jgi:hypothetical protein